MALISVLTGDIVGSTRIVGDDRDFLLSLFRFGNLKDGREAEPTVHVLLISLLSMAIAMWVSGFPRILFNRC